MRYVNWWYIAGAIATLVVSVSLGELWNMAGLGAVGVGWGAIIGTDLRERRKVADPEDQPQDLTESRPWWIDPLVTVGISAGLVGVGLAIAVVGKTVTGSEPPLLATVTTVILTGIAAIILITLVARARRRRARGKGFFPAGLFSGQHKDETEQ